MNKNIRDIIILILIVTSISLWFNWKQYKELDIIESRNIHYFNLNVNDLSEKLDKYLETKDEKYLIRCFGISRTIKQICYLNPESMPANYFTIVNEEIYRDLIDKEYDTNFYEYVKEMLDNYIAEKVDKEDSTYKGEDFYGFVNSYFNMEKLNLENEFLKDH